MPLYIDHNDIVRSARDGAPATAHRTVRMEHTGRALADDSAETYATAGTSAGVWARRPSAGRAAAIEKQPLDLT